MERKSDRLAFACIGLFAGFAVSALLKPEAATAQPQAAQYRTCTSITYNHYNGVLMRAWSDGKVEHCLYGAGDRSFTPWIPSHP